MSMPPPPSHLDGAEVLYWATSTGGELLFHMSDGDSSVAIHGLAICRYAGTDVVYRFSCDKAWEVQNDSAVASVEEAMSAASGNYDVTRVRWLPAPH